MRYLVIRHNRARILLAALAATALVTAVPWIYKGLFMHREDFVVDELDAYRGDFLSFLDGAGLNRNISADISFFKNGYIFSKWAIKDARLKNLKVSANIIVKGRFIRDETSGVAGFSGKLFSGDLTLKPDSVMPVNMSFCIKGNELNIESFRLGKSYSLRGTIGLTEPFNTDLVLDIEKADIKDVALFTKLKNPESLLGTMNGVIYIKGLLANLFSSGIIQSRNGRVGPVAYEVATIRLEGFGPVINIADANVRQQNGRLMVEGYLDLRNIGKGVLFDGLHIKSELGTILWDGWDIAKKGADELTMSKDVSDTMKVGFKTMTDKPFTGYYESENQEEMSLEYKMGLENLKMKLKDNEEFLVIEHNIRF